MRKQASNDVVRGRAAYLARAWDDAYELLSRADKVAPLAIDDLERLTWAAGLTGRDQDLLRFLERIYGGYAEAGDELHAARAAFWLCMRLSGLGEMGQASGWLSRAQRHAEHAGGDSAEQGYLLLPVIQRALGSGNLETAAAAAETALATGERFDEPDLVAFARSLLGRALLRQNRVADGLATLDEAMVSATGGELSPVVTGLVYCSVISCCQEVFALDRAREWTAALAAWCEAQPQLVTFTGSCLVHRAEILQLGGAWGDALVEARRAHDRFVETFGKEAVAEAAYQEGEIHRLRGDYAAAEASYREASRAGLEPQPGLSLLRVSQGQAELAAAAMRRLLAATADRFRRARLLPAYVEVMLGAKDLAEADRASAELAGIADDFDIGALAAAAAHATGAVRLAEGNPTEALAPLREAFDAWQRAGAPYIAARIRVLIGIACRGLGDEEGAALAFEAARESFAELGAAPDVERVEALRSVPRKREPGALTARELEVLGLVAAGKTNKAIARTLALSEKTVDRHLSNIFNKLGVPSRAAATAYAYEHKLI